MHRHRTSPGLVIGLLVAVLAASVAGGWLLASRASGDRARATAVQPDPAEPPYDAGDPADGPPSPVVAAATPTDPAPAPAPQAPQASQTVPTPRPPAGGAPTPRTQEAPSPAPEPAPEPAPDPAPAPEPQPAPTPEPGAPVAPYQPPPAIGIAADALPAEGRAWSMLASARRAAAAGSQERADLEWLVSFARSAMAPSRPAGRRATAQRALRVNAWWFARRPSPAERVIARDPDGVILTYKKGHGFMVNPVATMGRWRGLNELWSAAQLSESMLPMLTERTHDGREWAALEYFDVPGDPSIVRAGVSGMGQARAATLFAKAWAQSGDPRYLQAAQRVIRAFEVPVDSGGVRATVPDPSGGPSGTWFPERAYPGGPAWAGAALNGFMVTIIELRRAAAALASAPSAGAAAPTTAPATTTAGASTPTTPSTEPAAVPTAASSGEAESTAALARDIADRGLRSLVRFLPLHDSGTWSYYGLLTPGRPWRTYLADLNYHCYHVSLLRTLDGLYPGEGLGAVARTWQGYVDARGATCPAR